MCGIKRPLLLVALVLVLTACGSDSPTLSTAADDATTVRLTTADAGRTVRVPIDASIVITLKTIGPGQYGTPQVSSGAVGFESMNFALLQTPGGATQVFIFRCLTEGSATVTVPHSGAFPGGDKSFAVTLQCS